MVFEVTIASHERANFPPLYVQDLAGFSRFSLPTESFLSDKALKLSGGSNGRWSPARPLLHIRHSPHFLAQLTFLLPSNGSQPSCPARGPHCPRATASHCCEARSHIAVSLVSHTGFSPHKLTRACEPVCSVSSEHWPTPPILAELGLCQIELFSLETPSGLPAPLILCHGSLGKFSQV